MLVHHNECMFVPAVMLLQEMNTYDNIQRCVALWVLDVGWGALFEKQLDESVVAFGRRSVEGSRLQLVSGVGVCSIFQQHQGNLWSKAAVPLKSNWLETWFRNFLIL